LIGFGAHYRKLRSCHLIWFSLCALIVLIGCKRRVDNGYHVVAYNAATKEWTLIDKDFDRDINRYHRKRFVLVCSSYEYNRGGFEHGPDACVLHVGDIFETNVREGFGRHVYVDPEMKNPGTDELEFYMAWDEGDTHEVQFLKIMKEEVLPDEK
jgi:hypothetical protein